MKITAIETLRLPERPNLLLAQIHTDQGLVGLGETSRGAQAVEAQLHELVAPYLLGKDPREIQKHSKHLMGSYLGFASSSTEIRAASVVDVALWDILGQALNQPIHALLGGRTRERIRAYNTCAGSGHAAASGFAQDAGCHGQTQRPLSPTVARTIPEACAAPPGSRRCGR